MIRVFVIAALCLLGVQTRSYEARAQAPVAPWCGEFLPLLNSMDEAQWVGAPRPWVHFTPKYCNQIMIGGVLRTIPPGVAVADGGVEADTRNAIVDGACCQQLAPNMVWRAYVMWDGAMKLTFSAHCEHIEDQTYGNEVSACNSAHSFVGLVKTDANGLVCGGSSQLCVHSWFYRGHVAILHFIGPDVGAPASVCNTPNGQLAPIDSIKIGVLGFGVNGKFRQGYTVPNFHLAGTLVNNTVGAYAHAAIQVGWGGTPVTFDMETNRIAWSFNNKPVGSAVQFRTTGILPAPLVPDQVYYVRQAVDRNHFTLAATPGGPEIVFTTAPSGAHQVWIPGFFTPPIASFNRTTASDAGALSVMIGGAGGAEEGFMEATLMLGTPNGGCTTVPSGILSTSPHHS